MAVAKSYENMKIMGEPYQSNGKMYVMVSGPCKRCGGSGHYSMNASGDTTCYRCNGFGKENMEVRWYTNAQRASMDKAAEKRKDVAAKKQEERRIKFAARNAFGFGEDGYITLIFGNNDVIKDWREDLPLHTIWYNTFFGWFMPSSKHVDSFPEGVQTKRLNWDEVRDINDPENLTMRSNEEVTKYVHNLIYGESKSKYQGEKDEWLEHNVVIKRNIALSSHFGESRMHIMEDDDGNVYVWTTSSKNFEEGRHVHLRMKVKDHKEYEGIQQTIVYYCKEK